MAKNSKQFVDDSFLHLESDTAKLRLKPQMYISYVNEMAAKSLVLEILMNAIDECMNPRSPANTISIDYDELNDTIIIKDNGRGIPIESLELVLTTLNSGSNIDSAAKIDLHTSTLGRNGVGTIAYQALAERVQVTSYRGGTENTWKSLTFVEGEKINEEGGKCSSDKHGLEVSFKPSKMVLGKRTRIIWKDIKSVLSDLQFLLKKKMKISSTYRDKNGNVEKDNYKVQNFKNILSTRNNKENIISDTIHIIIKDNNVSEEVLVADGSFNADEETKKLKRFIEVDIAFMYTNSLTPYIDSFCNNNNTIDNGSHLEGVIEAINRFFQNTIKASMTDKEKERLDIKWEDVQTGLSLAVNLNTNLEQLFTSQTKHKITNDDLHKLIRDLTQETLRDYFTKNNDELKSIINIIKLNAKARREGEKVKSAVVKENLSNWSSFKMKNYDPCINKGKEYKELFIIEGDSAKGSLKHARDPKFQALFAIRGVSMNVFKTDLNGVLNNKEFKELIKVMGCNVGMKFDLSKLQFNKIVIASDADKNNVRIKLL